MKKTGFPRRPSPFQIRRDRPQAPATPNTQAPVDAEKITPVEHGDSAVDAAQAADNVVPLSSHSAFESKAQIKAQDAESMLEGGVTKARSYRSYRKKRQDRPAGLYKLRMKWDQVKKEKP